MPIYEYQCRKCEHLFDALQKINEEPLVDCPSCGENTLKRLISAPNFRLKGKGWYETDFKKENQNLDYKSGKLLCEVSSKNKEKLSCTYKHGTCTSDNDKFKEIAKRGKKDNE